MAGTVRTFVRKGPQRPESGVQTLVASEPVDVTDATFVFLYGETPSSSHDLQKFRAWATGDGSTQLDSYNPVRYDFQWSVCSASRFNPAADSHPNNGKFIFIQSDWSQLKTYSAFTKWLTNHWRGTPKDFGLIYLQNLSDNGRFGLDGAGWLSALRYACKAANLHIHPLPMVILSTGWSEESCREMYKMETKWIIAAKEDIREYPNAWAKLMRGEPRFARLLDEDTAIATVKLLFTHDS